MLIGLPRLAAFGLGIVSSLECEGGCGLSPCADAVYFIEDKPRGGRLPNATTLAPTSAAIVAKGQPESSAFRGAHAAMAGKT